MAPGRPQPRLSPAPPGPSSCPSAHISRPFGGPQAAPGAQPLPCASSPRSLPALPGLNGPLGSPSDSPLPSLDLRPLPCTLTLPCQAPVCFPVPPRGPQPPAWTPGSLLSGRAGLAPSLPLQARLWTPRSPSTSSGPALDPRSPLWLSWGHPWPPGLPAALCVQRAPLALLPTPAPLCAVCVFCLYPHASLQLPLRPGALSAPSLSPAFLSFLEPLSPQL